MFSGDKTDRRSFTQFRWFICFVQIRSWWKKSTWISHWASEKGTVSKFESKIKKIRKSNYPYEMCVMCTLCVQVRETKIVTIEWQNRFSVHFPHDFAIQTIPHSNPMHFWWSEMPLWNISSPLPYLSLFTFSFQAS